VDLKRWTTFSISQISGECGGKDFFLKIGQYLATMWTKVCGLLFWATLYILLTNVKLYTAKYTLTKKVAKKIHLEPS